ncbi:GxxExxY protein [Synoicihabitans lomoniglobus]|uniref:GxxExxY protein n=1 Tax=Synoicihabitans lomoniglobus TaxID=2909285 RepID=A0AAF0CMM3_9BACT|nr:GxxExxY protein [Opitutaceae bacterium LMO-M01]WED63245.1 GxxExxY protein [Opitutaceae bacterium LMO-M01]
MEIVLAPFLSNRKLSASSLKFFYRRKQRETELPDLHPSFEKASSLTEEAIASAIEVHRHKGPGLNESIYEWCLLRELELRKLPTINQKTVQIEYKGFVKAESLRFDVLLAGCLLIEAKSVEHLLPIHKAQLLTYMKLLDVPLGLLINFNVTKLTDGVSRLILPGANR